MMLPQTYHRSIYPVVRVIVSDVMFWGLAAFVHVLSISHTSDIIWDITDYFRVGQSDPVLHFNGLWFAG